MATNALFPNVKSPVQINTYKKLINEINAAGDTGISKPKVDIDKLVAATAPSVLIEVAPVDASGNQIVRMNQTGKDALAASLATPAAPKAPKAPLTFTLETGFTPAVPNRTGLRTSMYPFGTMEAGQSFFVPASAEHPDPAKSLASTVSAATRRYATEAKNEDGTVKTKAGRKPGNTVPVRINTKEFTIRAVEVGGVKGARIYRIK
jgi:hypothetical protein